eukprot:12457049-Alexandrium_andersonii.AAC.1
MPSDTGHPAHSTEGATAMPVASYAAHIEGRRGKHAAKGQGQSRQAGAPKGARLVPGVARRRDRWRAAAPAALDGAHVARRSGLDYRCLPGRGCGALGGRLQERRCSLGTHLPVNKHFKQLKTQQ